MSTAELVQQIRKLSNPDRLKIIEATTALIRDELVADIARGHTEAAKRMRAAALQAKDLYEPGGELAEWTVLDAEEILEDSRGGGCISSALAVGEAVGAQTGALERRRRCTDHQGSEYSF